MSIAIAIHLLSAVIWIGGMFFAYVILRPVAADLLEPPLRLNLWQNVFNAFFNWVWLFILLLFISGYWMAFRIYHAPEHFPIYINVMIGLAIVMTVIFAFLYFQPYQKLKQRLSEKDIPGAAQQLALIRKMIATNLTLGLLLVISASSGRYLTI